MQTFTSDQEPPREATSWRALLPTENLRYGTSTTSDKRNPAQKKDADLHEQPGTTQGSHELESVAAYRESSVWNLHHFRQEKSGAKERCRPLRAKKS
jgi:hypothetical protein